MESIVGPIVTNGQGPKVTYKIVTFGPVTSETPETAVIRSAFAVRVNEICDDMGIASGRGRQTALASEFRVNPKAARKWLLGLGYPEMAMAVRLADWADVNVLWLLQGRGPKRGNIVDTKALVLDEAVRSLPPELGMDLVDSLRSKLIRIGKLEAREPSQRYVHMLDAYEQELSKKH